MSKKVISVVAAFVAALVDLIVSLWLPEHWAGLIRPVLEAIAGVL